MEIPHDRPRTLDQLREIELTYKIFEAYAWLHYRFPASFSALQQAQEQKNICQKIIERALRDPALLKEFTEKRKSMNRLERMSFGGGGIGHVVSKREKQRRERELKQQQYSIEQELARFGLTSRDGSAQRGRPGGRGPRAGGRS